MEVWVLIPDVEFLEDDDWSVSEYQGIVHVLADTEVRARLIASAAFVRFVEIEEGDFPPCNPWTQPRLVEADILQEHDYDLDCPPGVVGYEDDDSY